jgi:choloylglycine hydrolase
MLKKQKLSIEGFADILNATKQNWGEGGTLYSDIYDLANREVYVFCNGKLDSAYKVNLNRRLNALKAGESVKESIKGLKYDIPVAIAVNKKLAVSTPEISSAAASKQESQPVISALSSSAAAAPITQGPWVFILAGIALLIALIWISSRKRNS